MEILPNHKMYRKFAKKNYKKKFKIQKIILKKFRKFLKIKNFCAFRT